MTNAQSIFEGKKGKRNKLILKSLVVGPKITQQIAEYVYLNEERMRDLNKNKVKHIYSGIARKGQRLTELSNKHYIERKNNLWNLTNKGLCVALTLFENVSEIKKNINLGQFGIDSEKLIEGFQKNPFIATLMTKEGEKMSGQLN